MSDEIAILMLLLMVLGNILFYGLIWYEGKNYRVLLARLDGNLGSMANADLSYLTPEARDMANEYFSNAKSRRALAIKGWERSRDGIKDLKSGLVDANAFWSVAGIAAWR